MALYRRTKVRLNTLGAIRTEMCSCYRAAVRKELSWQDFTRAVHGLSLIARLDEGSILEQRLAAIEARLALPHRPNGHDRTDRPEARL